MAFMRLNGFPALFREMNRFQEEFNRALTRDGGRWAGVGPAVNVWADDHAVYVETDLPGVDPAKLDVSVTEGNRLAISGERPEVNLPNAVWHRQERGHGTFVRELTLPTLVDADKVEAVYEAGVLRLTLPKAEAAKPRKITVRS
ncbi:MAG TPA: Hsp20/alpha crystallin family protein [Gemmataceae bacterium]|jgi:HSP20 family protein